MKSPLECHPHSPTPYPVILGPHLHGKTSGKAFYEVVTGVQTKQTISNAAYDWVLDFMASAWDPETGHLSVPRADILAVGCLAGHKERTQEDVLTKLKNDGWVTTDKVGKQVYYRYQQIDGVEADRLEE